MAHSHCLDSGYDVSWLMVELKVKIMALRVKYKDSYAPDIREVKDGKRRLFTLSDTWVFHV